MSFVGGRFFHKPCSVQLQQQQYGVSSASCSSKRRRRRRQQLFKLLLTIGTILLMTGIISHPFLLFHWYNHHHHHKNNDQLSSSSSSSSSFSSSLAQQQQQQQNNKTALVSLRGGDKNNQDLQRPGCLTEACIHATATTFLARTYPKRTDPGWCHRVTNSSSSPGNTTTTASSSSNQGLLLVKVPKGASSTAAGVAIRIHRRQHCNAGLQWRHQAASSTTTSLAHRSRATSFLFTTLRNPAARAVSTIFFHVVSRIQTPNNNNNNNNTTTRNATTTSSVVSDEFLLQYLQHHAHPHHGAISLPGQGGFQLRYTSLEEILAVEVDVNSSNANATTTAVTRINAETMVQRVQATINSYDFILVTERMEESLVAMSLLMGIAVGDVLVTASKVAGSRYHLAHLPGNVFKCIPTVKSVISPTVQAYLESDAWRAANYGDYLLHAAANLSLDRTIDKVIGRETFARALHEYQQLRALEQAKCAPQVQFPCSNDGIPQPELSKKSCYLPYFDFGCGHACIDDIIKQQQQQEGA